MAEAMELDLSIENLEKQSLKNPIIPPKNSSANETKVEIPRNYTIEEYYKDDNLGSDVLKQKYLAPWESHPYELWTRQAKALASVEKTKKGSKNLGTEILFDSRRF